MPLQVGRILIDGYLPPPPALQAALPPPPPPPPPAPQPPPAPPLVLPPVTDFTTDALVPPGVVIAARPGIVLIPAPPVLREPPPPPPAPPPPPPEDADAGALGEAEASTGNADDLPEIEIQDPFGIQEFAISNPSLKGASAVKSLAQACADMGGDALAFVADAIDAGADGTIGNKGLGYGPLSIPLTESPGQPFYGKGANNRVVNAWAWTDNGIRWAVRAAMAAKPSARGLRGRAAIAALVYGLERPADKAGAAKRRGALYDKILALGSGWPDYAAGQFKGAAGAGGVDNGFSGLAPVAPSKPTGAAAAWRSLLGTIGSDLPGLGATLRNVGKGLPGV